MAFDISTSRPVKNETNGFDISTSRPVDESVGADTESTLQAIGNAIGAPFHALGERSEALPRDPISSSLRAALPPAGGLEILLNTEFPEDVLPAVGQGVGTVGGFLGSIGGAAAGQAGRQGIRALRGREASAGAVGAEAARTATVEGLFRGTGRLVLRKEFAGRAMSELGRRLATIKERVFSAGELNNALGTAKEVLESKLDTIVNKFAVFRGPGSGVVNRWRKVFGEMQKGEKVKPRVVAELEADLGDVAKFAKENVGGQNIMGRVPKRAVNVEIINARREVSNVFDDVAEKAGFPEFKKISKKLSELFKKFPESRLRRGGIIPGISDLASSSILGGGVGLITQSGAGGLAGFALGELIQSQEIRSALFKLFVDKGLGRALTLGTSEGARRLSDVIG